MSRSGDEMIFELAQMIKTAEEKKEVTKPDGSKETTVTTPDGAQETTVVKGGTKEVIKKKPDGTTEKTSNAIVFNVINGLVKIADELDTAGEIEASSLVDDALQVILNQVKEAASKIRPEDVDEDITQAFEEDEPITGREEGMGTRLDMHEDDLPKEYVEMAPEGMPLPGKDVGGHEDDPMDTILKEPKTQEELKDLGLLFGR